MVKKSLSIPAPKASKQKELAKQGERKLMQLMHKPMIVEDKKKQASKRACRKKPIK